MAVEVVGGIEYTVSLDTGRLIADERKVRASLDRVGGEGDKLQARMSKISAAISGALAAIAVEGLISKLVTAQRQFDVLFSSLKTVTGGAEAAGIAFERLRQFAAQTPYTLDQAIQGFVKMKALGLDPSERAMTSFGNTAAAMGKDLMQMVEAVADAATGEFERLKEFGIKASVQGDKVALTFRGTTTTLANSASAITEYLVKIGETDFAGAMSERMKTLDGDISNLEDSLAALYLTISQSGFGDAIASGVRAATQAIQELTTSVKQGGLTEYFDALKPVISAAELAVVALSGVIASRLVVAFISAASYVGYYTVSVGAATIATRTFATVVGMLGGPVGIAITALALLALNWDKVSGAAKDAATISEEAADRIAKALAKGGEAAKSELGSGLKDAEAALADAKQRRMNLVVGTYGKGTPEQIAKAQERIDAATAAIAKYKAALNDLNNPQPSFNDRRSEGGGTSPSKPAGGKKPTGAPFDGAGYVAGLKGQLLSGLAAIDAAEQEALRRNAKLLEDKKITTQQAAEAVTLIEQKAADDRLDIQLGWAEDMRAAIEQGGKDEIEAAKKAADEKKQAAIEQQRLGDQRTQTGLDTLGMRANSGGLEDEVALIRAQAEAKMQASREMEALDLAGAQIYADQRAAIEEDMNRRIEQARTNANMAALNSTADAFGSILDVLRASGKEQTGLFKVIFAAQKAFSIASSIVAIQSGIAQAANNPWPLNLAAMASVAAATASIVSTIAGTNYGGGRQYGGPASSGSLYRVNETGAPEMFMGPGGKQYMMPTTSGQVVAADKVGGGGWTINIHEAAPGTSASIDYERRIIDIAAEKGAALGQARVNESISSNSGSTWNALRGSTTAGPRL